MNELLFKSIFYIKNTIENPGLLKSIDKAWANQNISKEELKTLQFSKLKKIVNQAYNFTQFYKSKFDNAGFHPNQLTSIEDIEKIPLLTKQEIRINVNAIRATNLPESRFEVVNTGGTTGIPMMFYRDIGARDWMTALYFRTIRMYGCERGTKTTWIWGLTKENEYLDFQKNNFFSQIIKNVTWFNGFDMNPERMKQFADFSFRFKPELLISYVSSLFEFAKFLIKEGLFFYQLKAIWLTAEPLDEIQKKTIESVFHCPTYSQYGASEILHIANECKEHNGLHIHADSRIVEITDSFGKTSLPGEIGDVVITDLENYAMPIIRYKNDDKSSTKQTRCNCGNNFPMINPILGRVYNVFKLRSGKQIYGHMFSKKLFTLIKEINQFQIHQTDLDNIKVYIVPGLIANRESLINELLSYFTYYTGTEVKYKFYFVDTIEREKSGKLLYTKSDV